MRSRGLLPSRRAALRLQAEPRQPSAQRPRRRRGLHATAHRTGSRRRPFRHRLHQPAARLSNQDAPYRVPFAGSAKQTPHSLVIISTPSRAPCGSTSAERQTSRSMPGSIALCASCLRRRLKRWLHPSNPTSPPDPKPATEADREARQTLAEIRERAGGVNNDFPFRSTHRGGLVAVSRGPAHGSPVRHAAKLPFASGATARFRPRLHPSRWSSSGRPATQTTAKSSSTANCTELPRPSVRSTPAPATSPSWVGKYGRSRSKRLRTCITTRRSESTSSPVHWTFATRTSHS